MTVRPRRRQGWSGRYGGDRGRCENASLSEQLEVDTMRKPFVYIASPYTTGDPAANTHFQCRVFDQILRDGKAWPIAPLWSHFQHTLFPRPYAEWIEYDKALVNLYDACLRLAADIPELNYQQSNSEGADGEVELFRQQGKPVFYSIVDLYEWIDSCQRFRGN
jgi:hypothetical protein